MKRLPNRPLTNLDIINSAEDIPYFRGVFMRNELPNYPLSKECGIINLDSSENPGTHWVAYAKYNSHIEYFDSYGNLKPPKEVLKYLGRNLNYNYENVQKSNPFNCGHLCLNYLKNFWCRLKNI